MSLPGGLQSRLGERPQPVCLPCTERRQRRSWCLLFGGRCASAGHGPGAGGSPPGPRLRYCRLLSTGRRCWPSNPCLGNRKSKEALLGVFSLVFTPPLSFVPAACRGSWRRCSGGWGRGGSSRSPPCLAPDVSAEGTESPMINLSS